MKIYYCKRSSGWVLSSFSFIASPTSRHSGTMQLTSLENYIWYWSLSFSYRKNYSPISDTSDGTIISQESEAVPVINVEAVRIENHSQFSSVRYYRINAYWAPGSLCCSLPSRFYCSVDPSEINKYLFWLLFLFCFFYETVPNPRYWLNPTRSK